jgi:hypothetical protein
MRYPLIALIFFALGFSRCKPYSYFNTSNDFQNINCSIHFLDGKELVGHTTIQLETGRLAERFIYLKTDTAIQKIPIDSIAFYTYNSEFYYPKEIDLDAYIIPDKYKLFLPGQRNLLFVKRLTKGNVKMDLFELYQSKTRSEDGADHYYYYVSRKSDHRLKAWGVGSDLFFPRFNEKMSKIVSDCPVLSNKIDQKENGYTLNQLSLDLKKFQVFKTIIEEYNNCN